MQTEALIKAIAADAGRRGPGYRARWALALSLALGLAVLVFALILSPRADLAQALTQPRFLAKLAVVGLLAATLLPVLRQAAGPVRVKPRLLWLAPLVLALAVGVEAWSLPSGTALAALLGAHRYACLGLVTLIGLAPLAVFLGFLRAGAPADPSRAGGLAGLASGAIAASLYALHCTDDSPLFVAVWYMGAILGLGALGAVLGARLARW